MNWRDRAKGAVGKNRGGGSLTKPTQPSYVSSVSSNPAPISSKREPWDYELSDLAEIDQRLKELAQLEGWTDQELNARIWERQHMATVNVKKALHALRIAVQEALAPWPSPPAKRAQITLCELVKLPKEFAVIEGGKPTPQDQAKRLDTEPEAA